jgi:1-acyl-sn-glycerol-3-phosphate acyltransferase
MTKFLKFFYSLYLFTTFLVLVLLFAPFILLCALLPFHARFNVMMFLVKLMSSAWFLLLGIRTKVYNNELAYSKGGAVIVSNHLSYLDAPASMLGIAGQFKALGKAEISKVPLFGILYKTVVITVDRGSTSDRVKSFRKMKEDLEKEISILVFPEGTFKENNDNLLPFHNGAFKLALNTQAFLQPILLLDTQKRMNMAHPFACSPGYNRVVVLPGINTLGISNKLDTDLKNYVFEYMNSCYFFCRKNGAAQSGIFAQEWLVRNPIQFNNL